MMMTLFTLTFFQSLLERERNSLNIRFRHRRKERQAETARIIALGVRKVAFAETELLLIPRLKMNRYVMHLHPNVLCVQVIKDPPSPFSAAANEGDEQVIG